jgi:hypothetical protein
MMLLGTGYLNCLYAYKRKSASPVLNVLSNCVFHDNLYRKRQILIKGLNEVVPKLSISKQSLMQTDTGDIHPVPLFISELHINLFSKSRTLHVSLHDSFVVFSTFVPTWIKVVLDYPQLTRLNNYELR